MSVDTTSAASGLRARIQAAGSSWQDFWFRPADTLTLGLMRLLTGPLGLRGGNADADPESEEVAPAAGGSGSGAVRLVFF